MLRISVVQQSKEGIRLALEGSLADRWVSELRRTSDDALVQGKTLELDLANLRYVDLDGCQLLRELASRKVNHINCSPFIQQHLEGIL
jgi:ABC-type transporter Mla MlaB component